MTTMRFEKTSKKLLTKQMSYDKINNRCEKQQRRGAKNFLKKIKKVVDKANDL